MKIPFVMPMSAFITAILAFAILAFGISNVLIATIESLNESFRPLLMVGILILLFFLTACFSQEVKTPDEAS